MIQHAKGADKLHFLVSAAVTGYLQLLGNHTPDITNSLGQRFLLFSQYQFEIIDSDSRNKARHEVAIQFYSQLLLWHNTIGNMLLVSDTNKATDTDGALAHLVSLQPFLGIYTLKTETHAYSAQSQDISER